MDRAEVKGITAVTGRAQMGKSWLLTEAARRLCEDQKQFHVGFTEASEPTDLFRQAVSDLYSRWLTDSTWAEQAQMVWKQQEKDLVGKVGTIAGTIFSNLSKLAGKPAEAFGGLVQGAFSGMAEINRELVSGPFQLPPLQSDDTRQLLQSVHQISGKPIVLVFDQWEKSPTLEAEAKILDVFLRHLDGWPPCHIIIGTQMTERVKKILRELRESSPPGWVEVYELPQMQLEDTATRMPLLQYVRERVPAARHEDDAQLLEMIAGYPGTLYKWTASYNASKHSPADLKKLADDANNYRFREFNEITPYLSDAERLVAMRLALISSMRDDNVWKSLRVLVLEGSSSSALDSLLSKGILEVVRPPSFGHPKRAEAMLQWFSTNNEEEFAEVAQSLVLSLSGQINYLSTEEIPFITALASLAIGNIQLSEEAGALFHISRALFKLEKVAPELLLSAVAVAKRKKELAAVVPLLAIGLLNTLDNAKETEDLELRDASLEALRQLALAYPQDAVARIEWARGMFNTLVAAKDENKPERRDTLLDELRRLTSAYPDTVSVREDLAKGLYSALF